MKRLFQELGLASDVTKRTPDVTKGGDENNPAR